MIQPTEKLKEKGMVDKSKANIAICVTIKGDDIGREHCINRWCFKSLLTFINLLIFKKYQFINLAKRD